jgi:integrase
VRVKHPNRARASRGKRTLSGGRSKWSRTSGLGRVFQGTEARRRTLAELLARYRSAALPQYSSREHAWRTQKLAWWERQLGHARLSDITPPAITTCKSALAETGGLASLTSLARSGKARPLGPATQVRYLAVLSHVFNFAVRDLGWLETNPVARVRRPREPRGRLRCLSEEERRRLLEACQASEDRRLYPLVVCALGTGARQAELLSLRWRDVDLQRGTAVLQQKKNSERRTLVLAGAVLAIVRQLATVRRIETDKVFAGARAGLPFRGGPGKRPRAPPVFPTFTFMT